MNKSIAAICSLLLLALLAGCSKTNSTIFSWDYQNYHYIATSASVADSTGDDRILALTSSRAVAIDGGSHLGVGSYSFHTVNNNGQPYMYYINVGTLYSSSGTLTITAASSSKLSGSFSVTFTDGTTMSGSFTDIPVN